MAANLNPPSHFSKPVIERENAKETRLLPPSSFQKQAGPDPWQTLTQARQKITELQQQNEQLRQSSRPQEEKTYHKDCHTRQPLHTAPAPMETHSAPQPPHPAPFPTHQYFHLQHTADILSKQASELAQAKSEVMTLRSQRQREVTELEERLRELEVKYSMETTSLTTARKCQEKEHRLQLNMMKTKYEAEISNRQENFESLRIGLRKSQEQHNEEVSQLREKLLIAEEGKEKILTELHNSNREKDHVITSLQTQLNQLKAYIGETQTATRNTLQDQLEREKQLKKIKDLEKDLDNQRSAVQLLNVRLSSANQILGIQEAELSRVKVESSDSGKKVKLLLTRWREKVFELMVQLKSQEIVEENIRRDHKWKTAEFAEERISLQNRSQLLEHSIADRDAQLQLEMGKSQSLQDELASVQEVAELLDSRLNSYEETLPHLVSLLRSFETKHTDMEEILGSLASRLVSYDKRINFAVGRIHILKGLVARKDALWRMREKEVVGSNREPSKEDEDNTQEDIRLSYDQLQTELQQVTHERDLLADRIKRDSECMQKEFDAVRGKFEEQRREDATKIVGLETQLRQREKEFDNISTKLSRAETEGKESQRTIGRLKTELAKLQMSTEKASVDQMVAMESQLTNQLAEMEQRLNAARREQAKAVVSLRQLERKTVREREHSVEMLKTQEEMLHLEIEKLKSQLRETDRDRNLLMATLKQEGLVGQYKAQRAAARTLDDHQGADRSASSSMEVKGHAGHQSKPKAPLNTILSELQSLTAQVLQDDDVIDDVAIENTDNG